MHFSDMDWEAHAWNGFGPIYCRLNCGVLLRESRLLGNSICFLLELSPVFAILVHMRRIGISGLAAICSFFSFCQKGSHQSAQEHMHKTDFDVLVQRFESEERNSYQKPDELMNHLDKTFRKHGSRASQFSQGWKGLKVADLGAGTGYFAFRMAEKGASVITLDIDERFLRYIEVHPSFNRYSNRIETRKIEPDSIGLASEEVDLIFSVNVYHHIDDRVQYFKEARKSIRDQGLLVIVDFKKGDIPVGPPEHIKLSEQKVKSELSDAGFEVTVDGFLQYQNIYLGYPK